MASEELVGQRIAIYARFSSEGQRESSIEDQVHRCREFITNRGGVVSDDLTFSDRALSGAGTDRPAYEQMMRLASARPRQLDVIVLEDLSRLSRSAADLFTIQRLFEFVEVRIIGVADGIDTFAQHSPITFGIKTLVSSIYLNDLRDKTLRGLEGRARAGLATGGVAFGYCLQKQLSADGKELGTLIEICEEQAIVVRRIFTLYLEGSSFAGIAKTLNADGVSPPRVHAKNRRVGWKDSTIRAMLHNESYIGRWRYKASQWRKVPGTNRRVPVRRKDPRALVDDRPALRIIDNDLWVAVQERLSAVRRFYTQTADGKPKGRALPGRTSPYLFSSLLQCGVCGSKMIVSGGSNDVYYRCEGHARRGLCTNALSVRESVVRASLLDELRRRLVSDRGLAYARKRLAEKLGELSREQDTEIRERTQRVTKLDAQIAKLVDFIAEGNGSTAVAAKLRKLELEADTERSTLTALQKERASVIRLPAPDDLLPLVFDFEKRLTTDITRGREELRALFRDGRITLIPQPDGFYIARSEILPLVLLANANVQTPPGEVSEGRQGFRYSASSCAGRI